MAEALYPGKGAFQVVGETTLLVVRTESSMPIRGRSAIRDDNRLVNIAAPLRGSTVRVVRKEPFTTENKNRH